MTSNITMTSNSTTGYWSGCLQSVRCTLYIATTALVIEREHEDDCEVRTVPEGTLFYGVEIQGRVYLALSGDGPYYIPTHCVLDSILLEGSIKVLPRIQ